MIYIIIGILLVSGFVVCLISCGKNSKKNNEQLILKQDNITFKKIKITPFLIINIILLFLSIVKFHLFNFWTLRGGESLVGVFALWSLLIVIILFLFNKILITYLNLKKVYIIELSLILIFLTTVFYNSRRIIYNVEKNVDYFAVVYNIENANDLDYSYYFLFSKKIKVIKNGIYFTKITNDFDNMPDVIMEKRISISRSSYTDTVNSKIYKYDIVIYNKQSDSISNQLRREIQKILKNYKE